MSMLALLARSVCDLVGFCINYKICFVDLRLRGIKVTMMRLKRAGIRNNIVVFLIIYLRYLGLFQEVLALRSGHRLGERHIRMMQVKFVALVFF